MIRGNRKQDIFLEDEDRFKFIKILKKVKQKKEYTLYAYCLMNNHVHLLIKEKDEQLFQIMKRINVSYAYYFNKKYQQIGHLFQDRFKSEPIEDESYLLVVLSYIHNNPLNAMIVKNLDEYAWSSFRLYVKELPQENCFIERENILSLFSPDKNKAVDLLIRYHHQKRLEKNNIIELPEENGKHVHGLINEKEVKQYIQNYFKEHGFELSNFKERKYQSYRNKLISYLRKNSTLSIRRIAYILRVSKVTVQNVK